MCVPVLGMGFYLTSYFDVWPMQSTWLPENVSVNGRIIDRLFNLIHLICAVIFILTTTILAICLWRYRSENRKRASHVHSNTTLEIIWSIIPAGILIFLALYQYESWANDKIRRPIENGKPKPPTALIIAKQFGWEVYYPGLDGKLGTLDDIYIENELYVPENEDVVLQLESRDVIHGFFVPVLRIKQDIVPGMTHYCWFRAENADPNKNYEIACTELCGRGHYRMKGWMHIVPREQFDAVMLKLGKERLSTKRAGDDQSDDE